MNLLIVDDSSTNLKLLRAQLEAEGHTICEAADGVEALAVLGRQPVDAVISDILMPRMDGYRLCHEIRGHARLRDLPFIIYTATYTSPDDEKLALDIGADKFIIKPASVETLVTALHAVIALLHARPRPDVLPEVDVLKEYSERLVAKLERKNIEMETAHGQLLLLATAMTTTANAIIIMDGSGKILWVNEAFTKMTGYTAGEAIGQTPQILNSGKHEEAFYEDFWKTLRSGQIWRGEFINRRKDGSLYYDEQTTTPVRDAGGKITHFIASMNDVTARKRAEEGRTLLADRNAALVQSLGEIVYDWNVKADELSWGGEFTRILGYSEQEIGADTASWTSRVHPEDLPKVLAEVEQAVRERRLYDLEYRFRHRDGHYLWMHDRGSLFLSAQGELRRIIGVFRDITERQHAEQERQKFVLLADSSSEFIGMCDLDMKPLYVNPAGVRMVGLPDMDAACRVKVRDYFFPEDQRFIAEEFFPRVLRDGHGEVEIRLRHFQTGEPIWMSYYLFNVHDAGGRAIGWATVSRDITARRQAEAALRESERNLTEAQRIAHIGSWIWNLAGTVQWTDELYRVYGVPRETFTPTVESFFDLVHPEDRPAMREWSRACGAGENPANFEFRAVRPDGTVRFISGGGELVRDAGGRPVQMAGTAQDITERKRAETVRKALLSLETRLSAASTPQEATRIIFEVADQLWDWDAGTLDVYSPAESRVWAMMYFDIVDGKRSDVTPALLPAEPSPRMLRILREGPELILRAPNDTRKSDSVVFGDTSRLSASILCAPLRNEGRAVGVLSIQSYTPNAFTEADLKLLQGLADHCGGTLERIRATEQLRQAETRLRLSVTASNIGLWDWNLISNSVYFSKEWKAQLGYAEDEIPNRFEEWQSRLHPEDLARTLAKMRRFVEDPAADYAVEFQMRHKDGSWRWIFTQGQIFRDAAGKPARMLGCHIDITERKHAEERVEHSNRVYSVLSAVYQTIVREKDSHAMLESACRIVVEKGKFRMAWIGIRSAPAGPMRIIAHAGADEDTLNILRAMFGGEPQDDACAFAFHALQTGQHGVCNDIASDPRTTSWREQALQRGYRSLASLPVKAGETVIGTFNLYAGEPDFFDEDELRLLDELAEDISFAMELARQEAERRKAEDELRWRTAFFEAQVNSALDGILVVDRQGKKILQNERFNQLWKIPPHIVRDKDDAAQLQFTTSRTKNPAQFLERVRHLYSHPDEVGRDEIELLDGTILDRYSSPVRDQAGKHYGRIWNFRDLTEQRQLEEKFRQSQKMEAIGQLAGGVAHDFNNILAAIMMQADLAATGMDLPREALEMLDDIKAGTERAANLTRQLLAFSRRQVMQPRTLDLNEVVTSLTKMLQRILGEDVRLQLNLHPHPLLTRADAGMLEQVLLNLVVNARDAMPGGGRLYIETAEKTFTEGEAAAIPDASSGRHVCLSVTDTGCGIAQENLSRIFEPFFTTKEPGKGTGLGLATVFGITKQHGGSLTVTSEVGKGTAFQIFLPAAGAAGDSPEATRVKPRPRGGTETILLVEDEPAVRMLTRTVLERAGYSVMEATHGLDALKVWEQQQGKIQLLFTDVVMPEGMSGRELARRLQDRNPGLRVIFTSGYSADVAGRELSLQEGQNFIQKPSSPQQVLETVRRCLDVPGA